MTDPIREIIASVLLRESARHPSISPCSDAAEAVLQTLHNAGYTIVRSDNVNELPDSLPEGFTGLPAQRCPVCGTYHKYGCGH